MVTKVFKVYDHENPAVQEAYAMLTANLHFINGREQMKSIAISSCNPGEGKTTLVINLAVSIARAGWKVLLVDSDIRKPRIAKRLNNDKQSGLADILSGEETAENAICKTNIEGLHYLGRGREHANAVELLCSSRFIELTKNTREQYDFVLYDTPAMGSVIDASIVASKSDATIIVAEMGKTTMTSLKRAKEQLDAANAHILGIVLNKLTKRDYKRYVESYNYFSDSKKFSNKAKKIKSDSPVIAD